MGNYDWFAFSMNAVENIVILQFECQVIVNNLPSASSEEETTPTSVGISYNCILYFFYLYTI